MADVFKDFLVVIESEYAPGGRVGTLTPAEFRSMTGCPKTSFLSDCIDSYNDDLARRNSDVRVRLEMRTRSSRKRR